MKSYNKFQNIFGFLVEFPSKRNVHIKEAAHRFADNFFEDIELEFADEMGHFKYFILHIEN